MYSSVPLILSSKSLQILFVDLYYQINHRFLPASNIWVKQLPTDFPIFVWIRIQKRFEIFFA